MCLESVALRKEVFYCPQAYKVRERWSLEILVHVREEVCIVDMTKSKMIIGQLLGGDETGMQEGTQTD